MTTEGGPVGSAIFISHTYRGGSFTVGSHHLSAALAKSGYPTAHVSTPFSLLHRVRGSAADRMQRVLSNSSPLVHAGVADVIPRTILPAQWSRPRYLLKAISELDFPRPLRLFVDQPTMAHVQLRELADVLVYRPTDLYLETPQRRMQARFLEEADGVVATSQVVLEDIDAQVSKPSMVLPNGVDWATFASFVPRVPRDGVAYVGALDTRFDWKVLSSLAENHAAEKFNLWGPIEKVPVVPGNVKLHGPIPYASVPDVLRRHRVGLLPFTSSRLNDGRSPMKLYEYLAAGLQVVTRERGGSTTAIPGVYNFSSEGDAPEALRQALACEAPNRTGVEYARQEDWSVKAEQLLRFADNLRAVRHEGKSR